MSLSKYLAVVLTLVLTGCATSGNHAIWHETEDSINQRFEEGVTTKDEVIGYLGRPAKTSYTSNGDMVMVYEFTKTSPQAQNYIPYNIFSHSHKSQTKHLMILLDEQDIVKKMHMTENESTTNAGVFHW